VALSEAARAFLAERRFATLATINPDGTPQQTVMWYELRGDHVVMNTARRRKKDQNMLHDPRISICVEDEYRYVAIAGVAELIQDQVVAQSDIAALALRYEGPERAAAMVRDNFSRQERITFLLAVANADVHGFEG